jgi:hypothetical protein
MSTKKEYLDSVNSGKTEWDLETLKGMAYRGELPDRKLWQSVVAYCGSLERDLVDADAQVDEIEAKYACLEEDLFQYKERYGELPSTENTHDQTTWTEFKAATAWEEDLT